MRWISTLQLLYFSTTVYGQVVDPSCPTGYARTIEWGACGGNVDHLQCATMDVPMNYVDSTGSLTIPIARYPAKKTPVLGSIFFNPGGPGGSALRYLASPASANALQAAVGPQWNIVAFDPRGVNINNAWSCRYVDEEEQDLSSSQGFASTAQSFNNVAKNCAAGDTGKYNKYIGTAADATDVVAVFQALSRNDGDNGLINFWGFSYGTLFGATLAAMFPSKIHRMVLDGNINPTDYYDGPGYGAVDDFDATVKHFFSLCIDAGSACPLYKGTNTTQQSLLSQLDSFLLKMSQINTQQLYSFEGCLFGAMYFPHARYQIFSVFLDGLFNKGANFTGCPDYDAKATKRDVEPNFDPSKTLQTSSDGVISAILGADRRTRLGSTGPDFENYWNNLKQVSTYGADPYAGNIYIQQAWQTDAVQHPVGPFAGITPSANILFLNGMYDPITPLMSANLSSAGFEGSGVVVSSGAGHCTSSDVSTSLQEATAQYFLDGQIPDKRFGYALDQPNPWISNGSPDQSNDTNGVDSNDTISALSQLRRDIPDDFIEILGITRQELLEHMLEVQKAHASVMDSVELGPLRRRGALSFDTPSNGIPAGCQPINGTTSTTTSTTSSVSMSSTSTLSTTASSVSSMTSLSTTAPVSTTWSYPTTTKQPSLSTTCPGITTIVTVTNCETQTNCPPDVPHCPARTITHISTTETVIPTITSWETELIDVCPTGLTTHRVVVSYSEAAGFLARPTGCPDEYTTAQAFCTGCSPQSWVEATVPVNGWAAVETLVSAPAAHGVAISGGSGDRPGGAGGAGGVEGSGSPSAHEDGGPNKPIADATQSLSISDGHNYGWNSASSPSASAAQATSTGVNRGDGPGSAASGSTPGFDHGEDSNGHGTVAQYTGAAANLKVSAYVLGITGWVAIWAACAVFL